MPRAADRITAQKDKTMKKTAMLALAGAALSAGAIAEAAPGDRLRERIAAWRQARAAPPGPAVAAPAPMTLAYGADPLQQLDLWRPANASGTPSGKPSGKAPLVLFVHGGGWKRGSKDNAGSRWAPLHFPAQGYAYAAIDYRLVPQATVEEQAGDVARALKFLLGRADELGIDPARVVLMGHSAGAQLVALVGTDERYLKAVGLSFADVAGVIPNDGAAYDVPAQMRDGPAIMQQTYAQAFGSDPARQRALSPTHHAATPNAPAFLFLHVQRPDGVRQAQALGKALSAAGSKVEYGSFPGEGLRGHGEINRQLGNPDYAATPLVDAWLKRIFAR